MKYIREDDLKKAFLTMMNKLRFGNDLVLNPLLISITTSSSKKNANSVEDIEKQMKNNEEHRKQLNTLLAKGYLERPVFTEAYNKLVMEYEHLTAKRDLLFRMDNAGYTMEQALKELVDFLNSAEPFTEWDDSLFKRFIEKVKVITREKVEFEFKCDLKLKERIDDIVGTASNSALTSIREALKAAPSNSFSMKNLNEIRFTGDRTLRYTADEIDAVFDTYEIGAYAFMLLSLLYPNLKYSQKGFHQDHMHPYTGFEENKIKGLVLPDSSVIDDDTKEDWRRRRNTLANLQLLEGRENEVKNATPLVDWPKVTENRENAKYLPSDVSYELSNFEEFMEKRQELMSKALKDILL